MLTDVASWALILLPAYALGAGVLGVLGAERLRSGDRVILALWTGVEVLALALLGLSVLLPLSPVAALSVAALLSGVGLWLARRPRGGAPAHAVRDEGGLPIGALVMGVATIAIGAASLASDRVTLYDSLVYHVGIVRWLREYGTVPGLALIHNRLAHASAWFALGAPFDSGALAGRAANIPLGIALVMVAIQGAVATSRVVTRRAKVADWFLLLSSVALIWPAVRYDAATPSPDVAANVLIVVVVWSMLVVASAGAGARHRVWSHPLTPRFIPFLIAAGACGMKLFALPAVAVASLFYIVDPDDDRGSHVAVARAGMCALVGIALIAPLIAASVTASGCPLFPSPVGCLNVSWSLGSTSAADYAEYIRDVARWESRGGIAAANDGSWIALWTRAHPILTTLAVAAPLLAAALVHRGHRGGGFSVALTALIGIAFVAWQAPAPRFLYAFVIAIPLTVAAVLLTPHLLAGGNGTRSPPGERRMAARGFVGFSLVASLSYAAASQKLNVVSWVMADRPVVSVRGADLVLPSAPEMPERLYRWRVNDLDVFTPVPRPVADTLGYRSAIDADAGFEKCSAAPLPCTPYIPSGDVHLRVPSRSLAAGFARESATVALTARGARCIGETSAPFDRAPRPDAVLPPPRGGTGDCGADIAR